jgi:hypothetical protein
MYVSPPTKQDKMAPVPLLSLYEPLKSIYMESTQVPNVSMSSFDASKVTDLKQSLGAFKSKFRCAIPEFTEASPNCLDALKGTTTNISYLYS